MAMTRSYAMGDPLPPLSKTMTQAAINLFEKSGDKTGPSQLTDTATARDTLGHQRHRCLGAHVADVRHGAVAVLLRP
jgi:hypothetical protein